MLTRDQLIELMLSRDAGPFDRALDVQVSRLRHRLGDDAKEPAVIKTVRGQGYVLAAPVESDDVMRLLLPARCSVAWCWCCSPGWSSRSS